IPEKHSDLAAYPRARSGGTCDELVCRSGIPRHVCTESSQSVTSGQFRRSAEGLPCADPDSEGQPSAHLNDEQRRIIHEVLGDGLEKEPRIAHGIAWARHNPPSQVAAWRTTPKESTHDFLSSIDKVSHRTHDRDRLATL